ncbi:MAG: zinc dependent phospholipase C family protein [Dehalococcoidia bacterium]
MPSLGQHMGRALRIADRLDHPAIEADRGAFYLGATAPDIRVITRRDRRVTHFFDLDHLEHQDSVEQMLVERPELARPADLDAHTRAFMAGYITHLVLDEVYIETLYREYFGARSGMADDPFANVLDRALQFEMNRRELEDGTSFTAITSALLSSDTSNAVEFLEDDYLAEWREVILDFASQGPTWDRFPRMMNIHLKRAGFTEAEIEEFAANGPSLATRSLEYVSEERVGTYVDTATDLAAARVADYLDATDREGATE